MIYMNKKTTQTNSFILNEKTNVYKLRNNPHEPLLQNVVC